MPPPAPAIILMYNDQDRSILQEKENILGNTAFPGDFRCYDLSA